MHSEIFKPVVVLVVWTLMMLLWVVFTRLPALSRAGIDIRTVHGGNLEMLDKLLPQEVQWPAHNYAHLLEQPTLFYAICIVLALVGWGNGMNATIAWCYVGLRIAHSIVQATFNRVAVRFVLFVLGTLCLVALTLHAALAVFHG